MKFKTGALVLAMMAVAGCTLNRADLRRDSLLNRFKGGSGQVIEPKRCALQLAILSRPLRDRALNDVLWRGADEQSIASEAHRALEVNGLRIGLITGDLPTEVQEILNAPPPRRIDPMQVILPDGEHTMVSLSEPIPQVSLLLNREDRAFGKDYKDASGWLRVTANFEGSTGVTLRFVPEIHHGPIQRAFGAVPNAGPYAPQQFVQRDGQQEETLRELAATLTLQPGQVAVIGCRPERNRSLGSFLFSQVELNSDRLLQKVLLVWASRSAVGEPGAGPAVPPGLKPVDPPDMPGRFTKIGPPSRTGKPASNTQESGSPAKASRR